MAQEIYVVCNVTYRFPVLATDTRELAEIKITELSNQFHRPETDYYIDTIDLYTND